MRIKPAGVERSGPAHRRRETLCSVKTGYFGRSPWAEGFSRDGSPTVRPLFLPTLGSLANSK